jgi:hypothetical protein
MAHTCLALKKEKGRGCFVILCSLFLGPDKPLYLLPPLMVLSDHYAWHVAHVT